MEDIEMELEQLGNDLMERIDALERGLMVMGVALKEALDRIDAGLASYK